jgi:hypothetical protein
MHQLCDKEQRRICCTHHGAFAVVCMIVGVDNGFDGFGTDVSKVLQDLSSGGRALGGVHNNETTWTFQENAVGDRKANGHPGICRHLQQY